jgi:hypothetical protein
MLRIVPTAAQWRPWSLPSKLTCVGAYLGLLSILVSLWLAYWPPSSGGRLVNSGGDIVSTQRDNSIVISGGNNQIGGSGNVQVINPDPFTYRPLGLQVKSNLLVALRAALQSSGSIRPQITFVPKMDNPIHIRIARELVTILRESGTAADVDESFSSFEPTDWGLVIHTHVGTIPYIAKLADALAPFFSDMKFRCQTNALYPVGKIRINLLGAPVFTPDGTVRFQ